MNNSICEICDVPYHEDIPTIGIYKKIILQLDTFTSNGQLKYLENLSSCSLENLKKQFEENKWIADTVTSKFSCNECKKIITVSVNTYRGQGSLICG